MLVIGNGESRKALKIENLTFTPKELHENNIHGLPFKEAAIQMVAKDIKKTVQSAISNAENNNQYDIDNLYVTEAYVGKSIVLKRFRARAKGRASAIKKPISNVTIILKEQTSKEKKEIHGTKG